MTDYLEAIKFGFEKGGPWLIIATVLAFACYKLFLYLMDSQNKRIEEGTKAVETIAESTTAIKTLTEYVKDKRN